MIPIDRSDGINYRDSDNWWVVIPADLVAEDRISVHGIPCFAKLPPAVIGAKAQWPRCSRRNVGGDHLAAAIDSSGDAAIHGRGDVVYGGFLRPPSNGFSTLITALTP